MNKPMPVGVDDFYKLRKEGYYFVDKTDFIKQLIDQHSDVTLITRPRRFGKTLIMSMLAYFFSVDKEKETRHLFSDLQIDKAGEKYLSQRGKKPVIFLTLKDAKVDNWEAMQVYFRDCLQHLFLRYDYLATSAKVQTELREKFRQVKEAQMPNESLARALPLLMQMLHQHYGKQVILLIDEYDTPIQQAWQGNFYEKCILFMKQMLGSSLKGNSDLDFAVMTGVLRVAKESIFSDLNNIDVCSVLSKRYADVMGFTTAEVAQMAQNLGQTARLPELKLWYDGYHFGTSDIYNPWSVINFFNDGEIGDYWLNTSENTILYQLLAQRTKRQEQDMLVLLQGKTVNAFVREGVIYSDIGCSKDALYTMLMTTGYLTVISRKRIPGGLLCTLAIPNREVRDAFQTEVLERLRCSLEMSDIYLLLQALVDGEAKTFSENLQTYIEQIVSIYDAANKESFYHGLLLGMTALVLTDYVVESNRESGYGRFDLALFPREQGKAGVIMEFKVADSEAQLPEKAQEALHQIDNRHYAAEFYKRNVHSIWKYGIAFCGKKICVKFNS